MPRKATAPEPEFRAASTSSLQRSYDDSSRRSASARLFPAGRPDTNTTDSVRRMSDIYTPRPFGQSGSRSNMSYGEPHRDTHKPAEPSQSYKFGSGQGQRSTTVATVRPVLASTANDKLVQDYNQNHSADPYQSKPSPKSSAQRSWDSDSLQKKDPKGSLPRRKANRERFMTISSSQPALYTEQTPSKKQKVHSVAGDLISTVSTVY